MAPGNNREELAQRIRTRIGRTTPLVSVANLRSPTIMRAMGARARRELINCYDCGNGVSLSAATCPHCGARQHSKLYSMSRREQRLLGIEARNDRTLVGMLALCTFVGAFWGAATGGIWSVIGYGLIGFLIGVPAGFVVNLSRRLFG